MTDDTVQFVLELEDHKALTSYVCAPATKRSKTVARVLSLAGVTIAMLVALQSVESFPSFCLGIFVSSVLLFAVVKVASSGVRKQLQPKPGGTVLCEYNLALTPDGLSVNTPHWQTLMRWSGVLSVDETPTHAFVKIDNIAAYTIPKRAFPDEAACRRFIEGARAYLIQTKPLR